jgi:hypothetical protein
MRPSGVATVLLAHGEGRDAADESECEAQAAHAVRCRAR